MFSKSSFAWGSALVLSTVSGAASSGALAGQLTFDVTLPQQNVAEYHKPYVAGYLEDSKGAVAANLFIWYDVKKRDGGGQKYLKDIRSWWRKAGRDLTLPIDGVTGATRAPGRQTLTLDGNAALKGVAPGQYNLVVEAAREGGGHDLVRIPLTYNPAKSIQASGKGDGELGDVKVTFKP